MVFLILPMILVNGFEGIGTGWGSFIPNYNPRDIVNNLKRLINNEKPIPMHPWYRGFQGDIEQLSNDRYKINGNIHQVNNVSVRITELPIRVWTQNYKESLELWISGTDKVPSWILEYKEDHTTTTVDFTIKLSQTSLRDSLEEGLEKRFKMSTTIGTSNMVCFDGKGRIRKYNSPEEILQEFYTYRLEYYEKRKAHMINILEAEVIMNKNKARFIKMRADNSLKFEGLSRIEAIELLESNGFERFTDDKDNDKGDNDDKDATDIDFDVSHNDHGYDYMMDFSVWKFGKENEQKILKMKAVKEKELRDLRRKTPQQLWIEDLDCFIESWDNILSQKQFITREVQVKPTETIEISPKSKKRSLSIDESSDDKVEKKRPLLIGSVDDAREKRRSFSIDESFDNKDIHELNEDIEEVSKGASLIQKDNENLDKRKKRGKGKNNKVKNHVKKNVISTPVIIDDDEYVESEEVSERPKKRPRRSTAKQMNYVELSDDENT